MRSASWAIILLSVLAVVCTMFLMLGDAEARTLLLEDGFTASNGSSPDPMNWTVYTQGAGDTLVIEENTLRATADNGGASTVTTRRQIETRELTVIVRAMAARSEGWPTMVQVRSLDGTLYSEWFTLYYDSDYGWTYRFMKDGTVHTQYTYVRTMEAGKWYEVNVTYRINRVDVVVTDASSGAEAFTKNAIGTDALSRDNLVSFGVWGDSRQAPDGRFDDFQLWDMQIPPNKPPVWALVPELEAVEDVTFTFDFSDYVMDPDDPIATLRLSSESEYFHHATGLVADFLFPDGVTSASVPMRLHDGESHSDTVVRFQVQAVNDPPEHSIPMAHSAVEDIESTIDLASYIWDVDSDMESVTLSVDSPYASVSGLNVTVLFPDGVTEYDLTVLISDGLNYTEATMSFSVTPVDDPPAVKDLPVFEAKEDQVSVMDLLPYIQDEDTPSDRLGVSCDSGHVQVVGLQARFLFRTGGVTEDVEMEVTDGNSVTTFTFTVTVREVNDPPVVTVNRTYLLKENEAQTLFMEPYVSDEDNPMDDLSLECDDPAVVEISGFNITLLYDEWQREHDLRFRVFDGVSRTNATVRIQVQEINDPPEITGIGGLQRPVVITIDEGDEMWYTIDATDEEQHVLRYTIDSMWLGVMVFQNGTLRVTCNPGEIGTFTAKVFVDDMVGGQAIIEFEVKVLNVNDPPSHPLLILPYNHSVHEQGTDLTFRVEVYDPDKTYGQVVTVTWESNASGLIGSRATPEALSLTTDQLPTGDHRITVTVTDGEYTRSIWFDISIIEGYVPPPGGEEEEPFLQTPAGRSLILLVIVIVLVTVALGVWMGRRTGEPERTAEVQPQMDERSELEALAIELGSMASAMEQERASEAYKRTALPEPVVPATDIVTEEAEPVPLTAEQEADREHTKDVREVMRVLTQLPRGLPTALWGKDINALAREIVDGPRREAPDGTPLVQVGRRWYVADTNNVGTFLEEWKDEPAGRSEEDKLPEDKRREKLDKLEDALLEGKISEETYHQLRKKYE